MPDQFQNKYRIESARLRHWDYSWNAFYFVTICTKNREHFFGDVLVGKDALPYVSLSEIGKIVETEWLKTFEMRPDMNLEMGEYMIMPNHFHAMIGIGENEFNSQRDPQRDPHGRDAMHCVSTMHCVPTVDNTTNESKNQFGPQSKNLASVIRGFKIGVTKNARLINPHFAWQSRYHDHIIRNDESFRNISEYIKNNPAHWQEDTFH